VGGLHRVPAAGGHYFFIGSAAMPSFFIMSSFFIMPSFDM
jgi:hypothetical protein